MQGYSDKKENKRNERYLDKKEKGQDQNVKDVKNI